MSLVEAKIHAVVYDEIHTPQYAIVPILKFLKGSSKILCPFDGENSNYVKLLRENGHDVKFSNLETKDFFNYTKAEVEEYDYIISNPPYSIKDNVLAKLYELNRPFAMLMPITTLEGKRRGELFASYGVQVLVLNSRVNFLNQKTNNYFNTSYFCYNVLPDNLMFIEVTKKEELK